MTSCTGLVQPLMRPRNVGRIIAWLFIALLTLSCAALAQSSARFFGMTNWVNGGFSIDTQPYPELGARGTSLVSPGIIRSWDTYTGWADLAKSRGHYDWSQLDKLMDMTDSHGASLVYVFGLIPDWAASAGDATGCHRKKNCNPPADLDRTAQCRGSLAGTTTSNCQLKEFVRDLLLHARAHVNPATGHNTPIKYIELGNETNGRSEWRGTVAQHVSLSRDIVQTARSIDKDVFVISPGVNAIDDGKCGPRNNGAGVCWLREWLAPAANNGARIIDAVGYHGYVDFAISRGTVNLRHGSRDVKYSNVDWDPAVWTGGTLTVNGKFANPLERISSDHRGTLAFPWAGPDWNGGYVVRIIRAEDIDTTVQNLRSMADANGGRGKPLWDTENSWCGESCPFNGVNVAAIEADEDGVVITTATPHAFMHGERLMIHGDPATLLTGRSRAAAHVASQGRRDRDTDDTHIVLAEPMLRKQTMNAPPQATWIAFPYARQSEYLARKLLIEFSRGVAGNVWYVYSTAQWPGNPQFGTLCDLPEAASTSCILRPAGEAWGEVYKWLVHARPVSPCSSEGTIWMCDFVDVRNSRRSRAIWNSSATNETVEYPVPPQFTSIRELTGTVRSMHEKRVTVGPAPILLESSAPRQQ